MFWTDIPTTSIAQWRQAAKAHSILLMGTRESKCTAKIIRQIVTKATNFECFVGIAENLSKFIFNKNDLTTFLMLDGSVTKIESP